jgi:hypothetical protein
MSEGVHFDGDPATDSARRHMERVLKGQPAPMRWAWLAAALGGGGVWMLWRFGQTAARERQGAAAASTEPRAPGATDSRDGKG